VKLIVGLGNPGIEYQFTPHNMGFLAVDRIAEQCGVRVANRRCRALTDLPLGTMRIRQRGSSAGHNGLESILGALGTPEFVRIRLGIAPAHAVRDSAAYVLSPFKKAQHKAIDELLDSAAEAVKVILAEGAGKAMNRFNRRVTAESPEK
jgi:PTH1 family peptidyl-tRNA hydrolase